jgi:hypothetical protein
VHEVLLIHGNRELCFDSGVAFVRPQASSVLEKVPCTHGNHEHCFDSGIAFV